ncbi:MAG: 3-keto-disaccharide hydrolase [Adhaeribacter sp.]
MKKSAFLFGGLILCILSSFVSFYPKNDWENLLDKDLSKWEMYLSYRHKVGYNGQVPKDAEGLPIEPIGYNKNESQVFSVTEKNGEPILRISGEIYGCVFTKQEYENYHLKLKVKWGEKKWEPRTNLLKDSGIVYHSVGESGVDYWRAWMLGQEFQIMEGHMGDYWTISSSAIDIRAFLPEGAMNTVASAKQPFLPLGKGTNLSGFCLRSEDHESPNGEWTEIELITFGDKSLHLVNGHVVMVLQNSRYVDNGKVIPLAKGKLQLQSEAAEVFYKDIKIKKLPELPKKYAAYFAN